MEEMFKEDEKLLLISSIMNLQTQIENKTTELNKLTEELAALNDSLKLDKEELLKMMKADEEVETRAHYDDGVYLFANLFSKNEFSYGDEKALLSKLQEMKLDKYIKVTTTTKTAVDKNALKKDLKTDTKLKEDLKDFVGDRLVEYVTVTTPENHQKMLEHIIKESKK